jgi:hypothetical protein
MSKTTTIEEFLNSKYKNFILFIEQSFGKENKLYEEISKLNIHGLINYADLISKVCDTENNKYFLKDSIVSKYLEENGIKSDNQEHLIKLRRYLEMFVNVVHDK